MLPHNHTCAQNGPVLDAVSGIRVLPQHGETGVVWYTSSYHLKLRDVPKTVQYSTIFYDDAGFTILRGHADATYLVEYWVVLDTR